MLFVLFNFDVRYYVMNKVIDSFVGVWFLKIDLCYKKGKLMFIS